MNTFKEFKIGDFVLRFYKVDHGWVCTLNEEVVDACVAQLKVSERDYNFMYSYAKGLEQVEKDLKAELDKQGEPVGWFKQDSYGVWQECWDCSLDPKGIPLYTTPQTKPLSDEEINKLEEMVYLKAKMRPTQSWWSFTHEFARAIEERHGIK